MFIGEKQSDGSHAPFDWGCYGTLPDVVVSSVLEKLTGHLKRQALGVPLEASRTVKQVVSEINANQGIKIEGDGDAAFEAAKSKLLGLCRSSAPVAAARGPGAVAPQSPQSPRSSLGFSLDLVRIEAEKLQLEKEKEQNAAEKNQLQGQLRAEKERAEAEKQCLNEQLRAEKLRAEAAILAMQHMEAENAALRAQFGRSQES